MSMADRPAGQPERPGPRRLTRSRTDRVIAGVCGGFAAYSGIDVTIVRLVWSCWRCWAAPVCCCISSRG
jgi:phage shock protein PspC (stress-responsive transcriptional regulator)